MTKNTFTKNSALIDANILSLRTTADAAHTTCGNINIEANTFTNNIGCSQTNGVAYIYCQLAMPTYDATTDTYSASDNYKVVPISSNIQSGVTLTANVIDGNFAGTNRSIFAIVGFPVVKFSLN